MSNKILIAADHAGLDLKQGLIEQMPKDTFEDLGTNSNENVDYPDYANELARRINLDNNKKGVLICGTGVGMSVAANKFKNIRAGLVYNSEVAKLIREHNDANILVLPGKYMDIHEAKKCVENFLTSSFEGGRHMRRLNKIVKE
jgi:ribose 5-phosphate isomerase B|tara:strand:- start:81 stop:512 length:432 start_codon:yes stop_codon:yes gene_type:complete